jgi:geranylgeranyl diphosphate synthase type I
MAFESRNDVTEAEYIDMVQKKTGALFAASAATGGILAGGKPTQVDALHKFGLLTGIAFQIQDDIIDITSPSERTGKDRASDIREGKQTLIAIRAREKGIDLAPYQRDLSDSEIDELMTLLTNAGVIDEVRDVARGMVAKGSEMLRVIPESPEKQLLLEIGRFSFRLCLGLWLRFRLRLWLVWV